MLGDMNSPEIKVTATCVRVPVPISHGESIYIEVEDKSATVEKIQELIKQAPGAVLEDDPKHQIYPQPINAVGKRDTFVGRIRPDLEKKEHLICGLFPITF
jgi:Aspartate-semialdehyde dehydrogenase